MPADFLNQPALPEWTLFYWNAFWELHSDRPIGMATGPIPFSSIDRFAARYGIVDIDDFETLRQVIRGMDTAHLAPSGAGATVRVDDAAGMKAFMSRLTADVKARRDAKAS